MNEIKDNLIFKSSDGKDEVIFNKYTFQEIIKGCIIKYAKKKVETAENLLENSFIFRLPNSFDDVFFLTHEHEYHWAMLISYGDNYWNNKSLNISSKIPDDYEDWEKNYIEQNNLSAFSYEYL